MMMMMMMMMMLFSAFCPTGAPAAAFNAAWQRSLLQQPLITCQLLEAVTRSSTPRALQQGPMAKQAVLTAHQLLKAITDILGTSGSADSDSLRAALAHCPGFAEQLFLFVFSLLKLLRGFYRLHAGSSGSAGLTLQGWQALGIVHTALQCALAAAAPAGQLLASSSGSGPSSSSSSSRSVAGAAAGVWPLAAALALRDAAEIMQYLLQGHGLPPTHNAALHACGTALLRLIRLQARTGTEPASALAAAASSAVADDTLLKHVKLVQGLQEADAAAAG
jgi:hypothetical protein